MSEWVSQREALRLLKALGDDISQPALSQYMAKHPEVKRQSDGPGRPMRIEWESLKTSRISRRSRGPAEAPLLETPAAEAVTETAPEQTTPAAKPDPGRSELSDRKAQADVSRSESDARRARILADEAEGRLIPRDVAVNAFMSAGTALVRSMEEKRRGLVDAIRASRDTREADLAVRSYETAVRQAFAGALNELAQGEMALAAE